MSDEYSADEGDAAPAPELALQLRNSKHLKQVGVAVRRPRLRASGVKGRADEDRKNWELTLFEFSDSSEFANLETLLVQLAPSKCFLSSELEQGGQQIGAFPYHAGRSGGCRG